MPKRSSSSSPSLSPQHSSSSSLSSPNQIVGFQPIIQDRYAALVLPGQLNNFPDEYLKHLPRFNGQTSFYVEDHFTAFLEFVDNMNIEHEDVYMRLFFRSLEGNVRIWFRQLRARSIPTWNELINIFKNQWGFKKNHVYYLT